MKAGRRNKKGEGWKEEGIKKKKVGQKGRRKSGGKEERKKKKRKKKRSSAGFKLVRLVLLVVLSVDWRWWGVVGRVGFTLCLPEPHSSLLFSLQSSSSGSFCSPLDL